MSQIIIAWFSCGITSAVACKIALQTYKDVVLYYTDTGSQEEDSLRFLHDCEQWFGQKNKHCPEQGIYQPFRCD